MTWTAVLAQCWGWGVRAVEVWSAAKAEVSSYQCYDRRSGRYREQLDVFPIVMLFFFWAIWTHSSCQIKSSATFAIIIGLFLRLRHSHVRFKWAASLSGSEGFSSLRSHDFQECVLMHVHEAPLGWEGRGEMVLDLRFHVSLFLLEGPAPPALEGKGHKRQTSCHMDTASFRWFFLLL